MTAVFDNVRLPDAVEQGSTGGPTFNTSIVALNSGREARNQNWTQQRMAYDVGYGITKRDDAADSSNFFAVMEFFYARRGRFRGFRFKDWTDYQADHNQCATTATATVLQLQRVYASGGIAYTRKITRPVSNTVVLFDANGVVIPTSAYTVDYATGLVTFATAPTGAVSASFEFDVPVRFDTDTFTMTIQLWDAAEIQSLPIKEVME